MCEAQRLSDLTILREVYKRFGLKVGWEVYGLSSLTFVPKVYRISGLKLVRKAC